jgi:hypothetical protein
MKNNESEVLGTISLEPHQENLINQFALTILDGTLEQAVDTYQIIFEEEPSEMDLLIFKALCEQKLAEQDGTNMGIKGVLKGGKQ